MIRGQGPRSGLLGELGQSITEKLGVDQDFDFDQQGICPSPIAMGEGGRSEGSKWVWEVEQIGRDS